MLNNQSTLTSTIAAIVIGSAFIDGLVIYTLAFLDGKPVPDAVTSFLTFALATSATMLGVHLGVTLPGQSQASNKTPPTIP